MTAQQVRFEDGAAYERMMGTRSRLAGEIFLDWLAPPSALRWIDIGCGNGAFTELLVDRCAPVEVPRPQVSSMQVLRELWAGAGLDAIEAREITVQRAFANFEEFWTINLLGSSVGPTVAAMAPGEAERLKEGVRAHLPADAAGRITLQGRANAIQGRVPE